MVNSWSKGTRKRQQTNKKLEATLEAFSGCQRRLDAIIALFGG